MKKRFISSLLGFLATTFTIFAATDAQTVQGVINNYLPKYFGVSPKVTGVKVDTKARTVTVDLNEAGSYIPLTTESLQSLKSDVAKAIDAQYAHYKVIIKADGVNFDRLALFASKPYVAPGESGRFVTNLDAPLAPKGMDGAHLALWQSHGLYYQGQDRWGWQRPRLWQTCEDLFTQSFVMPFLMPMLENAGAYVLSPRERDVNILEYVIDNDNPAAMYSESTSDWSATNAPGFGFAAAQLHDYENPFTMGTARVAEVTSNSGDASVASWNADFDADGLYAVYVSYQSLPNSATDALYTVNAANGAHRFKINQKMGGGTWIYLGHFPFVKGTSELPVVQLSNLSDDKKAVVVADAVKIGGGMGNVARRTLAEDGTVDYDYMVSGYPRFTEGARYWLQWAGAPDSVYSATGYTIEYNDDYRSRGMWVNWLAGGSSVLPDQEGLRIPIDLSFAFHSDAGITHNDSIIGTLGIYCTDKQDTYPNGTSRLAARDLTDLVLTNIVNDVQATYEPQWTRRGMWNSSYAEARVPQVPAMLLELMSHQNFADMRYGLDPGFRFVVSRAIYKAMLKYLANRDGRDYVVQPLPVHAFAINGGANGEYTLSWDESVDSLEATAHPAYYIVEHRAQGALGFAPIARVTEPHYTLKVDDNDIHSYRIVAANDGGVSFPSEVLALRYLPGDKQAVIVNGFTRVSGPDWIDVGEIRGFFDEKDAGVPYIQDISFVGQQFEWRDDVPWMSDEVSGLGASRSDYEDKVVGGNTFDFVYLHGASIAAAGYGFISSSAEAFVKSDVKSAPRVLDLIFGLQKEIQVGSGRYGTRFKAFDPAMQQALRRYTSEGGSLLVTGSYIATDLWCNTFSNPQVAEADRKFATDVLGFTWRATDATEGYEIKCIRNKFGVFDGLGTIEFLDDYNSDMYAVKSAGSISVAKGANAAVIMEYVQGSNLPAATAFDAEKYRSVAIGVPFESIVGAEVRDAMMKSILNFLNK